MTEEKGKATMSDIAHGGGGAPSVGGVSYGNLEPLLLQMIAAIRAVSLTVNVPALGPPEIEVKVAAPDVHIAAPAIEVPESNIVVTVPPQTKIIAAIWCLVASVWCLVAGDIALKVLMFLHPAP